MAETAAMQKPETALTIDPDSPIGNREPDGSATDKAQPARQPDMFEWLRAGRRPNLTARWVPGPGGRLVMRWRAVSLET
jgi:hypothetical protein